jgi:hypothetical protein
MLKRILVPLDTSEYSVAATHMAATLANREQAVYREPRAEHQDIEDFARGLASEGSGAGLGWT